MTLMIGSDKDYRRKRWHTKLPSMASGSSAHTVTNEEFRPFVDATKYVAFAERRPSPEDYSGA